MNRSPALAGVLSALFPGLGHLYAGANHQALALAAMFAAVLYGVTAGQDSAPLVIALPAIWIFGVVSAVRITEASHRARTEGREAAGSLDNRWAAALVAAGGLATLNLIPSLAFVLHLWPLLLIWVGLQMLRRKPLLPWVDFGGTPAAGSPPPTAEEAGETTGSVATRAPEISGERPPPPPKHD